MQSILSNICADSAPTFLGLFDPSIAPTLLYYAYIPAVVAAMFFACFLLIKDKKSLLSKLLFGIALFFSLWVINIIVQWIAVPNPVIHFSWQLTGIFELPIFLLSVYFIDVFINQKDISFRKKLVLTSLYLGAIVFVPTQFNIASYDSILCQGVVGNLWHYIYGVEFLSILWIGYLSISAYKRYSSDKYLRQRALMMSIGMVIFLGIFFASNYYGEILQNYELNLIGPIGMALFLGFVAYVVVKYKTFKAHIIWAQVLVCALWITVFSLLFISNIKIIHYIVSITFVILIGFGILLIKSISREVQQRERLEELRIILEQTNASLESANEKLKSVDKLKTEFLSLASHQLRTPLTAIKGYSSMLIEGSFGKLTKKIDEPIKRIYTSAQGLVSIVEDLLNVSKIEQGGMKYEMSPTDLAPIVHNLYGEMQIPAQSKNIIFTMDVDEAQKFVANVDPVKIKQVFLNLTDNSIKYTPQDGTVTISLRRVDGTIEFAVKDNGVGITPETKAKLFEKFSRGEGGKMNTGGSGLGLYLARQIALAHKGDVVIESDGMNKGSVFKVVLPAF